MGAHRNNPVAIAATNRPSLVGVDEILGFRLESAIELCQERMAEIHAAGEAAKASGGDERVAVHDVASQWNAKEHPEAFDLVIYACATVGRPSALMPDPRNVPTASIRIREFLRLSLASLRKAADAAFVGDSAPAGTVQH
jgi:hypothetical protein